MQKPRHADADFTSRAVWFQFRHPVFKREFANIAPNDSDHVRVGRKGGVGSATL
jgi:hypothetical protein